MEPPPERQVKPVLYVVATPIGNPGDITQRAIDVLRDVDFVICEEYRIGSSLLKALNLSKPLELLNEHNETPNTTALVNRLLQNNEQAALISDAGTPLFEDPGVQLVQMCHQYSIKVIPIPGASSLMAALMAGGIRHKSFYYRGFLPAKRELRHQALADLRSFTQVPVILLDTPYRLKQLLEDTARVLGRVRRATLAYRLTMREEALFRGSLAELIRKTQNLPKGEFVLIIEPQYTRKKSAPEQT